MEELFEFVARVTERYVDIRQEGYGFLDAVSDVLTEHHNMIVLPMPEENYDKWLEDLSDVQGRYF